MISILSYVQYYSFHYLSNINLRQFESRLNAGPIKSGMIEGPQMQYWKTQSGKYRIGKYRAWNTNACLPDTNFRPQYVSGTMDIRAYKTDTVTLCDSTAFVVRRSWHYWSCIFRSCIFSAPVFITIDHPASYIILVPSVCVCLYVCMYVCQTITFESLGRVRIWRSSGQGQGHRSQLGRKFLYSQCKTSMRNNSRSIKHRAVMFACSMGFWGTVDRMV